MFVFDPSTPSWVVAKDMFCFDMAEDPKEFQKRCIKLIKQLQAKAIKFRIVWQAESDCVVEEDSGNEFAHFWYVPFKYLKPAN